jgi:hypothetical protein
MWLSARNDANDATPWSVIAAMSPTASARLPT